jgi:hypothetical protein
MVRFVNLTSKHEFRLWGSFGLPLIVVQTSGFLLQIAEKSIP